MAFRNWRIGMHIQQDKIAIVALRFERSRWALCRWWHIALAPGIVRNGQVADGMALAERLLGWRRELPLQHQVSIAFPASRTLQKRVPSPQLSLRESEQAMWAASAMAQQLEMPVSSLCVDYSASPDASEWRVTAAQLLDIDALRQLAARLKLRVSAIVPDASALSAFFPWLPAELSGLAWHDEMHWIWALPDSWGSCPRAEVAAFSQLSERLNARQLGLCSTRPADECRFDPWSVIHRLQPPLPSCGDSFAVALGLALGVH